MTRNAPYHCRHATLAVVALPLIAAYFVAATNAATTQADFNAQAQTVRAVAEASAPSLVRIETIGGIARNRRATSGETASTGVIVSADGYIVVSSHAAAQPSLDSRAARRRHVARGHRCRRRPNPRVHAAENRRHKHDPVCDHCTA
ncbi:MAG: S1C family serine protease [Pirellulales bacterium]